MVEKVVVIGVNGQLGSDLVDSLRDFDVMPLTHEDIEITNHDETRKKLVNLTPDIVINTAAFHRVDDCEDDPQKSFDVNCVAVHNLSLLCRDLKATFVHMSTDYVFGGEKTRETPYLEEAKPWPINVYGASKLAGEFLVMNNCPKHFVIRVSGLFGLAGSSGKGGNFIELMIRLAKEGKPIRVVDDQRLAPTFTADLAAKIVDLIQTELYGLYHLTNGGDCSWYEFAARIFELTDLRPELSPTTTESFGAKANRPRYSVLYSGKLEVAGLDPCRHWANALKNYLHLKEHI